MIHNVLIFELSLSSILHAELLIWVFLNYTTFCKLDIDNCKLSDVKLDGLYAYSSGEKNSSAKLPIDRI